MSGWFELTDAEYTRIAPLLLVMTSRRGGRWCGHRRVLNGILFRVRTGVSWRDVLLQLRLKLDERVAEPPPRGVTVLANVAGLQQRRVIQRQFPFADQYVEPATAGLRTAISSHVVSAIHRMRDDLFRRVSAPSGIGAPPRRQRSRHRSRRDYHAPIHR